MVKKDVNSRFLNDKHASSEAACSFSHEWAMGIINDERAFLSCVSSIDKLLGISNTPTRTDAIVRDKIRDSYFEVIISACRQTKLNVKELAMVLENMCREITGKKTKSKTFFGDVNALLPAIVAWSRFCDFEPEWHMRMRGDTRQLPSSSNPERNMWGYLRRLYTDPEAARIRQPDGITKMAAMYPGYDACVRKARRAGQDELKRLHGADTDLSFVTDKPKYEKPGVSLFLTGLKDGSLGELLSSR